MLVVCSSRVGCNFVDETEWHPLCQTLLSANTFALCIKWLVKSNSEHFNASQPTAYVCPSKKGRKEVFIVARSNDFRICFIPYQSILFFHQFIEEKLKVMFYFLTVQTTLLQVEMTLTFLTKVTKANFIIAIFRFLFLTRSDLILGQVSIQFESSRESKIDMNNWL